MKGSVFKRCTTCGRRPGTGRHDETCEGRQSSWSFRVDVGKDRNGRRLQRRGGGFDTKREAERALRELLSKVDGSTYVEPSGRTLEDFLVREWLETQLPPKVSPNRYRNIRNAVERHLVPHLGGVPLQELTAAHLDRFYSALLRGKPPPTEEERQPLAPATVVQIHGVIRKALRDARKWGVVEQNVATLADPPSNASVEAARRRAIQIWTPEQLTTFLSYAGDHWLYPMWLLVATTGMRRGELGGLVDENVDLDEGKLVVAWQLVPEEQVEEEGVTAPVHKPVMKSGAGSRPVDLDDYTLESLRRWREHRDGWRRECGRAWRGNQVHDSCRRGHGAIGHGSFLFTWPDGRHLNPDWISHEFASLCEEAGVPAIRLHDVRHTYASLLLANGENPKVVQERLGWASAAFMLKTYTHLVPGMQRAAAQRFAEELFGPKGTDAED